MITTHWQIKNVPISTKQAIKAYARANHLRLHEALTLAAQLLLQSGLDGTPPHASTGGSSPSESTQDGRESAVIADTGHEREAA